MAFRVRPIGIALAAPLTKVAIVLLRSVYFRDSAVTEFSERESSSRTRRRNQCRKIDDDADEHQKPSDANKGNERERMVPEQAEAFDDSS
jgi:hypothetical protein